MNIDPALLSAMSALVGALIGGGASLTAAVYTQRHQDRLQRVARETTKREQVYADFIMDASKLLLNAHVHEKLTLQGTKMFEDTYVNLVPRSWQQTIRDEEPGRLLAAMCVVDSQSELIR